MLDHRPSVVFFLISSWVVDPSCADLSTHMEWLCSTNWPRQQKQARSQPTDCRSDGTLCPPSSRVHHSHTAGSLSRFPWSCTAAHTRRWAYCSCAIFCPLGNCQSMLSMLFFISFEFVFSGILTLLYFGRCNHYLATASRRNVLSRNSYVPYLMRTRPGRSCLVSMPYFLVSTPVRHNTAHSVHRCTDLTRAFCGVHLSVGCL